MSLLLCMPKDVNCCIDHTYSIKLTAKPIPSSLPAKHRSGVFKIKVSVRKSKNEGDDGKEECGGGVGEEG